MRYNGKVINSKVILNVIIIRHDIIKYLLKVGSMFTIDDISVAIAKNSITAPDGSDVTVQLVLDQLIKCSIVESIESSNGNYQIHSDVHQFLESLFDEYQKVSDDEFNHVVELIKSQKIRFSLALKNNEDYSSNLSDVTCELTRSFESLNSLFFRNYQALNRETNLLKQSKSLKLIKLRKINYLWENYLKSAVEILTSGNVFLETKSELVALSDNFFSSCDDISSLNEDEYLIHRFRLKIQNYVHDMHHYHNKMSGLMRNLRSDYRMTDAGIGASLFIQKVSGDLEQDDVSHLFDSFFNSICTLSLPSCWANSDDVQMRMMQSKEYVYESSAIDYKKLKESLVDGSLEKISKFELPSVESICSVILNQFNGKSLPKDILKYLYITYGRNYSTSDFFVLYSSFFYNNSSFDLIHESNERFVLKLSNHKVTYSPVGLRSK